MMIMILLLLLAVVNNSRPLMAFHLQHPSRQQRPSTAFKKTRPSHCCRLMLDTTEQYLSSDDKNNNNYDEDNNNNSKQLNRLYQTVAQQDPEWFQTFVVQMLAAATGADNDDDALQLLPFDQSLIQTISLVKQQQPPSDEAARIRRQEQERALQRLWKLQREEPFDGDATTAAAATTTTTKTMSTQETAKDKYRSIAAIAETSTPPISDTRSGVDELLQSSLSSDDKQLPLNEAMLNTACTHHSTENGTITNTTTTTTTSASATAPPTPTNDAAKQPVRNETAETALSHESNETTSALQATRRPLKEKTSFILDTDKEDAVNENNQSLTAAAAAASSQIGSVSSKVEKSVLDDVDQQQKTNATTLATEQNVTAAIMSPQTLTIPSGTSSGGTSTNKVSVVDVKTTTAAAAAVDNRLVLYQETSNNNNNNNVWKTYPLSNLVSLGYTHDDVSSMDPDVLALIIRESLSRPRSGIPSRWKSLSGETQNVAVQIVASETAAAEEMSRLQSASEKTSKTEMREPEVVVGRDTKVERAKLSMREKASSSGKPMSSKERSMVVDSEKIVAERNHDLNEMSLKRSTVEEKKQAAVTDEYSRARNESSFEPKKNTTVAAGISKERPNKDTQIRIQAEFPGPKQSEEKKLPEPAWQTTEVPPSNDLDSQIKERTFVNTTEGMDTLVALFQESGPQKKWRTYPVQKLTTLGYSQRDISSMDPDALALIIQENLSRPRSGIPPRWKSTSEEDQVQLVSKTKAEEIVRASSSASEFRPERSEPAPTKVEPKRRDFVQRANSRDPQRENVEPQTYVKPPPTKRSFSDPETRPRRPSVDEELSQGRARQQVRERPERPHPPRDEKEVFRERRRQERREPIGDSRDRSKVYSGRPNETRKSRQRPNDPPPPTGFWPDIDKFRSMLRDEASLRLRLLGDDWAGVVKEESDWRLGLYEKWLWVLHNGVGTPIVESRMDRLRRMEQQNARRKRQAATESARRRKRKLSKD